MGSDATLQRKTLKELQVLAKTRGLKRYSRLTKEQLVRLLSESAADATSATRRARKTRSAESAEATAPIPAQPTPPAASAAAPAGVRSPAPATETGPSEEWVERSKYASRPNGRAPSETFTDLGEDIDRLPTLSESVVCLLSQKPGVLHAYWVLPPEESGAPTEYRLRLCRGTGATADVCEEVTVPARQGNWYFHVADARNWELQLGYYRDGRFVAARGRSIAQLPSLYASSRTDERWWISEADFARMYLRGGGFVAAGRFGWNASIGSPTGAPPGPVERLGWPGGVSSPSK